MRLAVLLGPACLAGLGAAALSCTPRDDLSSFSSGNRAAETRPLAPAAPSAMEPPGQQDSASGAALPGEMPAADETAAQPSGTPPSSEEPAPASGLADSPGTPGAAAPAMGDTAPSEPDGAGNAAAGTETPATGEQPPSEPQAPVPPPPPAPQQFRFVRLVADSDVTQGPLTSIAELDVLGSNGQPLDHTGWVATADSAEAVYVGGAPPAMAIDGLPTSMWHTPWFQVVPPPHPHFLQLDLGTAQTVSGFRYLARQDGAPDGRIEAFRFFVSADGVDWGQPVLAGTLSDTDQPQDVRIPAH
jgi:hypothetical protein